MFVSEVRPNLYAEIQVKSVTKVTKRSDYIVLFLVEYSSLYILAVSNNIAITLGSYRRHMNDFQVKDRHVVNLIKQFGKIYLI